jgi:hypothetical protein
MSQLKLFLQIEGRRSIELIEVSEDAGPDAVLAAAAALGLVIDEAMVFAGEDEHPLHVDKPVHVHRCKKINVALHYADTPEAHHDFAPTATVNHVKRWYVNELKMSPVDASEHVLQITGTTDRPDPDVQIGALVSGCCELAFSLVPVKRVEG